MKRSCFTFIFLFFSSCLFSQIHELFAPSAFVCSYYGDEPLISMDNFKSGDEAESIINNIVSTVGLKPNFYVRAADIPNAAAVIYQGKRYVLYNPRFVENLNRSAGNQWASVSILAHEVGHHLNGHTLTNSGSRPDIELEADEFSGFILRKLGAPLKDAQVAMRIAADVKASHSHPAKADRLNAIEKGWKNADVQVAGKPTIPKSNKQIEKPVITKEAPKVESSVLAEKYIAYDVVFNSDPTGKYFVTIRNNLVKVFDTDLIIVGVLAESNKKNYQAMFYDKHFNYLYINGKGQIVNGMGKVVGIIKTHAPS